ncbi:MAG TPA: hypothetical protein VJ652_15160 [Noviherbaspirillum sp.]|nr:hypothetical protein [Noviherbaspirillum sp.]
MNLIDNARQWHKLWSVRLAIITAVFTALEASLPLWNGQFPPGVFAGIATFTAVGGAIARIVKQQLDSGAAADGAGNADHPA